MRVLKDILVFVPGVVQPVKTLQGLALHEMAGGDIVQDSALQDLVQFSFVSGLARERGRLAIQAE